MKLAVQNLDKSFADNRVLAGVDMTVEAGQVVALVGENGAGKSTLIRIISGAHQPDAGGVLLDDAPVTFSSPREAMARGIQVIYQELQHNLLPQVSVAENIYMLDESKQFGRFWVRKRRMAAQAQALLSSLGISIDPRRPVGQLAIAEQQMVEIPKAMVKQLNVLILDEPTAALGESEVARLFAQIQRLRADGVAILYISHRLEEVFTIADRVVVLLDGAVSLAGATQDLSAKQVVGAMVGRTIDDFYPKERHSRPEPVLEVRGLSRHGSYHDVDLTVHAGEVLGIGGVMGCGKSVLLRSLFGELSPHAGAVRVNNRAVFLRNPQSAMRAGIAYLTPDRQQEGLCLARSVADNLTLATFNQFSTLGVLDRRAQKRRAEAIVTELKINTTSVSAEVGQLSGGNQQKVLFGKWLLTRPRLLLLEEPTRGVDVGAKIEIYHLINRLAADGVAIILVASDMPELVAMSNRLVVMRDGRVVTELVDNDISQHNLLHHALAGAA